MIDVEFDLESFTALDMHNFLKATQENDLLAMGEILASGIITKCPTEWGSPDDPMSYMKRPYFTIFQELVTALASAGNELSKN